MGTHLGRVPFQRAIVTYLDVLGFRSILSNVTNLSNEEDKENAIGALLLLLQSLKQLTTEGGRVSEDRARTIFRSKSFSDLCIRATTVQPNTDLADYLNWELMYLSGVQMAIMRSGFFVRGAVTLGDIYIDDDYVLGPALVRAYDLESRRAIYPRIVIDSSLLADARSGAYASSLWEQNIGRGEDGIHYINYLQQAFLDSYSFPQPGFSDPWAELSIHRDVVSGKLELREPNEGVKQKYLWLGLYHNSTVLSLRKLLDKKEFDTKFNSLLIAEGLLRS
jgi:hypothetical protein